MSEIQPAVIEGRVVCDARAEFCHCVKDAGHVEAGDPVHSCPPDECTGAWQGQYGVDFVPVTFPRKACTRVDETP